MASSYLDKNGLSYFWGKIKAAIPSTYAGSTSAGGNATKTNGILYGQVDDESTSTAFTATVSGLTSLYDGACVLLKNGVVTSASGFTININSLGAKPVYSNLGSATAETDVFNVDYTMLFVYDSTRVSGGCWICYRGLDSGGGGGGGDDSFSVTSTSVTIATTDWSNNACTKSVTGVSASNDVIVTFAPTSRVEYLSCEVYCTAQAENSLTFSCSTTPSSSITVNVMILDDSVNGDELSYGTTEE